MVGKKAKVRYVFTSSNTAKGFHTFIPELIEGLRKVYILKGAAGTGKSTFIRLLGESLAEQGYEIEFWISALEPVTPEGLLIPQLEAAVVNGSLPHPIDPRYPGGMAEIINLGEYGDKKKLESKYREIMQLILTVEKHSAKAYNMLKSAAQAKEQIKNINDQKLNIAKVQQLADRLDAELLTDKPQERHFYASAVTSEGIVNYLEEISEDCRRRYIFKGIEGSGKSTIIFELARKAKAKGHFLEYYYCGLDGESLMMIVIRNLQIALMDGGKAQMLFKPGDIVIDMDECLNDCDIDQLNINNSQVQRNYEALLLEAQNELENTYSAKQELKKIYSASMDFKRLDEKRNEIRAELGQKQY